MNQTFLIEHERAVLRDLVQLVAERARSEAEAGHAHTTETEAAEKEFHAARQELTARLASGRDAEEREFQELRQRILASFEAEHGAMEKEYQEVRLGIADRFDAAREGAKKDQRQAHWEATAVLEAAKKASKQVFKEVKWQVTVGMERLQTIRNEANSLAAPWSDEPALGEPAAGESRPAAGPDPLRAFHDSLSRAESRLADLRDAITRFSHGRRLLWLFPALWLVILYPAWLLTGSIEAPGLRLLAGPGLAALAVLLAALGTRWWLGTRARARVRGILQPLDRAVRDAELFSRRCREGAIGRHRHEHAEIKDQHDEEVRRADERYAGVRSELKARREEELRQVDEHYPRALSEIQQRRGRSQAEAEEGHRNRLAEMAQRFDSGSREHSERHAQRLGASRSRQSTAWESMASHWEAGLARVHSAVGEIRAEAARLFPDWSGPCPDEWPVAESLPPAIRFGEFPVRMDAIPDGVPRDGRLRAALPLGFVLPALLPFPSRSSMLVRASDEGRGAAVQLFQAVMLRLLTAIPPGKVRFTIIDPVGLGENFAAFMHLADHDESLVTSRIWTEPAQIDQRLADLTAHMENVIQKYLRNEFDSIEQYNEHAGEVAEPFRFLVVANFPTNFSESTARRLVSIATSGARCGVHTLISVDTRQPMPRGLSLADLEPHGVSLTWKDQRLVWKDPDFGGFPLRPDTPPAADCVTRVLQRVGVLAREANRVEVPFEFIAPAPDAWWTGDSRRGISVPLGRAGATKLQHLKLGQGTAQHVLIAGRTGSGKSTLLHALITNLSLLYSPDEVELYLVDFKKGVEFKAYATHELPHARVIAIESEREFGLSVLERLDAELKVRGEKFRELGVQDLSACRQANGNAPLPRILLIVDEFQEFFVEDDRIAQDAALLLDRLVRQGRAFGIHVQLGSQTLGGAYALARSTIGQMAVRIALQCSETDAHLILSEDNTAARLLSRPGEAIYNDANGMVEGNNFFQVVWLPDDRREDYLRRIRQMARSRPNRLTRSQIVFEGNTPSDVAKNEPLHALLAAADWPVPPRATPAWLGEAIAIKDPTAAVFQPQTGSNLLIVGQQPEAALGILITSLISLGAHHRPAGPTGEGPGARFCVLDGGPADAPHAGWLGRFTGLLPHPFRYATPRDLLVVIAEIAGEVERRQAAADTGAGPLYLAIHDLGRFRDLRRQEEEFSFSRRGDERPASPAKQFAAILRDGPVVGVHTIVWCDSLSNANRALDRQGLREFEMRVVFQMSPADSSNLIDTPLAGKLGLHRALFASEEQGQLEKFRPYGLPPEEWLSWLAQRLRDRH